MIIPFEPRAGLVIIPLKIFGPANSMVVRFAVDTGATESVLKRNVALLLGYGLGTHREKTLLTATSSKSSIVEIVTQRIEALGEVREGFPMLCSTFPRGIDVDGFLAWISCVASDSP